MSAHQTCTACGHANPASRLICESCGAPLAMAPAGSANMRTQAIPSLDELLTEDRQAFHDRLRSGQLEPPAEVPTQGLDYNQFAAQLAGDRPGDFDDSNDFEDEENAAPTEAIDFNKIAAQFPELAALRSTGPLNPAPADAPKPAPTPMQAPPPVSAPAPAPAPSPASAPMDDLGIGATPPPAAGRANRPAPAPAPAPPAKKKLSTGAIIAIAIVVGVLFLLCLIPGALIGGTFITRARLGEAPAPIEGGPSEVEPQPEAPAPEEGE